MVYFPVLTTAAVQQILIAFDFVNGTLAIYVNNVTGDSVPLQWSGSAWSAKGDGFVAQLCDEPRFTLAEMRTRRAPACLRSPT